MRKGFLFGAIAGLAPIAVAGIRLEVASDRSDAVYRCGERAIFSVRAVDAVTGAAATDGAVRVRLDNLGEAVVVQERTIDFAKDGSAFSLTGTLGEPGFLRLRALPAGKGMTLVANAGQGEFNWAVAYEPERIRPGAPCPDDFDAFWADAIAKYDREVPEDIKLDLYPPKCTDALDFYRLSLATVGGRRLYGSLARPKDLAKGPYPLLLQVPGAGPSSVGWGQPGQVTVFMNVHTYEPLDADGAARARRQAEEDRELARKYGVPRYAMAGISESREAYYYYATILGIRRAFHWAANLPEVKATDITYDGTSQGGGFGLIMTAMCPFMKKSTVFVPALTDLLGYKAGNRRSGWPRLVESQPEAGRAAAERWAPYFDGAHFAARIRTPIAIEVGFGDVVCPPQCGYAAYNVCPSSEKHIHHGIGQGHAVYGEFYRRLAEWRKSPAASARFISLPGGLTYEACEVEAQRATEAKSDICPAWGKRIVYRKGCKR